MPRNPIATKSSVGPSRITDSSVKAAKAQHDHRAKRHQATVPPHKLGQRHLVDVYPIKPTLNPIILAEHRRKKCRPRLA